VGRCTATVLGVTLSRDTGQVTHKIAPNVDAERNQLVGGLNQAQMVTSIYQMRGIGPTLNGRNGEGDPYDTDGESGEACPSRG
jgi:LssY C-terminus